MTFWLGLFGWGWKRHGYANLIENCNGVVFPIKLFWSRARQDFPRGYARALYGGGDPGAVLREHRYLGSHITVGVVYRSRKIGRWLSRWLDIPIRRPWAAARQGARGMRL